MKKWKLSHLIMLSMILGIVVGYACHQYAVDEAGAKAIAADFGVVTTIFLHMVKMIIAPLVFATIPAGVVPQRSVSAAIGLNMAQANLLGGVLSPILAGAAAETWGLRAPMFILVVLAAGAALVSLLMRETQQATGRAGLMSGPRAKAAMR